ncbi:hypothetical protein B0T11DRAFT_75699 [Plectosphaerella cucumerina]|uniref:Uncharacterized protein n=1 Tax=Plectosphaerella cucumerina TaxID=40658 RepID=A0A8K0X2D8_9PEZI|nr:hypothetical protein B0T11DRAFT_75699 [Plectosphaerella cucumerina]
MYWSCRTFLRSEGSTETENPVLAKYLPPSKDACNSSNGIPKINLVWYSVAEQLSNNRLIRYTAGPSSTVEFATHYHRHGMQSKYAGGLWVDDLEHGLLWYSKSARTFSERASLGATWSWTGAWGPVSYCLLRGVQVNKAAKGHGLSVPLSQQGFNLDPKDYGLSGEYLELKAMTLRDLKGEASLSSRLKADGCDYFFDELVVEWQFRGLAGDNHGRFMLMFIAPWGVGLRSSSGDNLRCIGLILQAHSQDDDVAGQRHFRRVGLFLGFRYDGLLKGWTRRTVFLV